MKLPPGSNWKTTQQKLVMIKLKGTFLDEITHDIPKQNWGPQEWAADFDAMKAVGIDTVIIIRAGYKDQAIFNSEVLQNYSSMIPAYDDLMDLFLKEAERCGMDLYFGLYDSGKYWHEGDPAKEVQINKEFTREVAEKYGERDAFKGWYISHEIDVYDPGVMEVYTEMSEHLKSLKELPVLISPYVHGVKQFGDNAISFKEHTENWNKIFAQIKDSVDIVAFQDGQVGYGELQNYLRVHKVLADKYGIESWSNVESFDRDMPIKFPPIPFKFLRYKMEQAAAAGVENLITFEFSHFMSPNSIYPAARNLYKYYRRWLEEQEGAAQS